MGNSLGIQLALCAAVISGFSVFINGIAVSSVDPSIYTTLKGVLSFAIIGCVLLMAGQAKEIRSLSRKQWGTLILIGLIGGSVPFLMFFTGLKLGGAAVSSFIYRSLFIFAGVFGFLILKERPQPRDIAAGLILLAGNAILVSGSLGMGLGQWLVLGATVLWALEYTISRKAISDIHPRIVMAGRMFFGSLALIAFLALNGSLGAVLSIAAEPMALMWLTLTSCILAAFLIAWYSALKRLPVLKAASIFCLGGVVTAGLNLAFLGQGVSFIQAISLALIMAGVCAAIGIAGLASSLRDISSLLPGLME